MTGSKPKMLLHVCCANCVLSPYSMLKNEYEITLYFYNPNIYPLKEYNIRLSEVKRITKLLGIKMVCGPYDIKDWLAQTQNLKDEPEGGKRCHACFSKRLSATASFAKIENFNIFASTLSVSPHKNSAEINKIGAVISGNLKIDFYPSDFKKKDGFKKTMQMSKELNVYRQNYCGCIYSIKIDKSLS